MDRSRRLQVPLGNMSNPLVKRTNELPIHTYREEGWSCGARPCTDGPATCRGNGLNGMQGERDGGREHNLEFLFSPSHWARVPPQSTFPGLVPATFLSPCFFLSLPVGTRPILWASTLPCGRVTKSTMTIQSRFVYSMSLLTSIADATLIAILLWPVHNTGMMTRAVVGILSTFCHVRSRSPVV